MDCVLPAPRNFHVTPAKAEQIQRMSPALKARVASNGLTAVKLDRRLSPEEFLEFARLWGEPIPEHDAQVLEFVDNGYILNIFSKWDATDDPSRQPFSESEILLHSEASRRSIRQQPRFLIFFCIEPPDLLQGGQTILVSMADVASRLSSEALTILQQVRYRGDMMPAILRKEPKRWVFSFRDFGHEPLQWSANSRLMAGQVNNALDELMRQLYDRASAYGIYWQQNLVLVLDNQHFFHGRTRLHTRNAVSHRRLQRIRVAGLYEK